MLDFNYFINKNKVNNDNLDNYLGYIALYLNTKHALNVFLWFKRLNIDIDKVFNYLSENNKKIKYNYAVYRLINDKREDIVTKYLDYFYENNDKLLELKNLLNDTSINQDKLNIYINKHESLILEEMILSSSDVSIHTLKKENLYDFYKELVRELIYHEKKELKDIQILGRGAFTTAYLIGDKVLKIGKKRKTFNIRNHKRFLKPLLRKEFIINNELSLCIEIVEKLDMDSITKKDVELVEKELELDNRVWRDSGMSNVGRLLKDNMVYYDNIDYVSKEVTGYLDDNNEVLKKGDIVFADNDYIYELSNDNYNPFIMKGKH